MENEMKCPKCGQTEKTKSGFHRDEQRYKCESCGCDYAGGRNAYPRKYRTKSNKYYLEVLLKVEETLKISL